MPSYLYICRLCAREREIRHAAKAHKRFTCLECGAVMSKKPVAFAVNWNGLKPSEEVERSPAAREWLDNLPQLRDEFAEKKEKHVRRTEHDTKKGA